MRLRPSDFKAAPSSPFASDRLAREGHVKALCSVVSDVEDHGIITIDAPWGAGKTAFLKMIEAHLQSTDIRVVEFNAWLEGYTQRPTVDLVSAITHRLGTSLAADTVAALKTLAVALTRAGVRFASHGYFDPDDMSADNSPIYNAWSEAEEKVTEFSKHLGKIAASADGPIVVTIDELDRCRPAYALELLDAARQLFAIDGVVLILAINRAELCHSIKTIYGDGFDVDRYLRRFADLSIQLPSPKPPDLSRFLDGLLIATGLSGQFKAESWSGNMLQLLTTSRNCSLRDLEQAVHLTVVTLASLGFTPQPQRRGETIHEQAVVALIVLRFIDTSVYYQFTREGLDPFKAVAKINAAILPPAGIDAEGSTYERVHQRLESLLLMGPTPGATYEILELEEKGFTNRYTRANAGDESRAAAVYKAREHSFEQNFGEKIHLRSLASIIDLVDITTT